MITYDARGNGRSDRPVTAEQYAHREIVADAIAVLDAVGVSRAVFVGTSMGALYGLQAAAWYPDRVLGVVAIGSVAPFVAPVEPGASPFYDVGAAGSVTAYCAQRGLEGYREFVEFFMRAAVTEPHRTKAIEDAVGWGLETTPEVLALTVAAREGVSKEAFAQVCAAVRCPVLVVHGDQDGIIPYSHGVAVARLLDVGLVTLEGGGHLPSLGDPVRCNLLIREFAESLAGPALPSRNWSRALHRRRRVLVVSSPIGLGHARRDLAIADELRALHPDLEVEWLAQHPVTEMLAERGERVHPASRWLANESAHIESESGEHDLHVFQAYRRMDEILVANFHVFHDLVAAEAFDLVVADEGWDIDYFLHDNPELKRSPFGWLTDFVGWLPMADGGPAEAALTTDYNAEMIEQIARYPRLRDRSIFVGNPADLVTEPLGSGLPTVRDWTLRHFDFAGYVTGPLAGGSAASVAELRAELGYRPDERVCLVAVGGSGIGRHLLRRVASRLPGGGTTGARVADDRGVRAADRSRLGAGARRGGGPRVRTTAAPRARRLRHRGRAGRVDHHDGAGRGPASVPVLPARPPLRAAGARAAPPRAVPGRPPDGIRHRHPGGDRRRDRRPAGRATGLRTRRARRCPPRCPAARRAALISPGRGGSHCWSSMIEVRWLPSRDRNVEKRHEPGPPQVMLRRWPVLR